MEIYKPKTPISKYYIILFSLPRWQYLAIILLSFGIILLLFMRWFSLPLLFNSIMVFMTLKLYSSINKGSVFYKLKRIVGLSLAVLVYTSIYTAITGDTLISLTSSTALLVVVILGLEGTFTPRYLVAVTPPISSLLVSYILDFYSMERLLIGLLLVFAIAFINVAIYVYMSRRRVNGYSIPDLGTLFLKNWLDRRTEIERVFENLGEYQYVNPRIIEFGDLLVIYADVHYGPFSNVGSSKLPNLLKEAFRKLGYSHLIPLHGLGSHDRNIVSSKHVSEYVEQLTKTFISGLKERLLYHGSFILENDEWRVLGLIFDKVSVLMVSRPRGGIDDLPYSIQLEYELKARSMGLGDVIIIDTHNCELENEPDLVKLRDLIDISLLEISKLKKIEPVDVKYKYKCFEAEAPGLVNNEACILCISGDERSEACLVYLRGNNMKPGVRDLILEEAKVLGISTIEVLTNDEHSETGTRAHIAYIPVHESANLLRAIRLNALELKESKYGKTAWLYTCRMDLKLMGGSITEIKQQLTTSIKESAFLLLAYVFLTPLVLVLFV